MRSLRSEPLGAGVRSSKKLRTAIEEWNTEDPHKLFSLMYLPDENITGKFEPSA
jgi:hypothetical protein